MKAKTILSSDEKSVRERQYECTELVLLALFILASEITDFYLGEGGLFHSRKKFASREAQNAQKMMTFHTHKI